MPLHTVIKEHRFEEEAAAINPDIKRVDEALGYVEFQLARFPSSGIATDVPGIWVVPVQVPDDQGRVVRASVFYTFTGETVHLQSIRLAP